MWTRAEDACLREAVAIQKKQARGCADTQSKAKARWKPVELYLHSKGFSRTRIQCRNRWMEHLRPGITLDPFSIEDEMKLVQLHAVFGNQWCQIAEQMGNRSSGQVRTHYNNIERKVKRYIKYTAKSVSSGTLFQYILNHDTECIHITPMGFEIDVIDAKVCIETELDRSWMDLDLDRFL